MNVFKDKLIEAYYEFKSCDLKEVISKMKNENGFNLIKMDGHRISIDSWYKHPIHDLVMVSFNHRTRSQSLIFEEEVPSLDEKVLRSWVLECLSILLKDINDLEPLGYKSTGFNVHQRNKSVCLKRENNDKIEIWKGKAYTEWHLQNIPIAKEVFRLDKKNNLISCVVDFEKKNSNDFIDMNQHLRDLMVSR